MTDRYFDQTTEQLEEWIGFMEKDLKNIKRAINAVEKHDLETEFLIHAKAETVEQSANNTGVDPSKIVKTLVFIADEPIAVLCPGDKRVDEQKLEEITGKDVRMAKPAEVKEATGYHIGGVSPFDLKIPVYMEKTIIEHDEVKPAAGSRVIGAKIDPEELKELTDAETADFVE